MDKQIKLEIEELEERIAPATLTLTVTVSAAGAAAGHNASSVPPVGATVNAAAVVANGANGVGVS